jgi:prepilin signal peptidase PulO-like enzyme (type II secretory pathway)
MQSLTILFERLPMVWFLLGLLFNATGLYVGFDNSLSFAYMIVGWFCCAYGLALFVLRLRERPRTQAATRLSPNFVSAGETVIMPTMPTGEKELTTEQQDAE